MVEKLATKFLPFIPVANNAIIRFAVERIMYKVLCFQINVEILECIQLFEKLLTEPR